MSWFSHYIQPFIFLIFPLIIAVIISLIGIFAKLTIAHLFFNQYFFILINIPIIYGIYPAFQSTKKFYEKRGYANVVLEYEFIKKFLLVSIPLVIIFNIYIDFNPFNLFLSYNTSIEDTPTEAYPQNFSQNLGLSINASFLWAAVKGILTYVTIAGLIRIVTQIAKKEFRFYFTKGYCKIISEKKDNFEKLKYLFPLIKSYNKYLERNLKIKINDIKKIYSIILYKDTNQQLEIINSICILLEGDRLKLARYLSSFQKVPDSELYIKESIFQQLKVIGVFLAAAIPIIISIIQLTIEILKLLSLPPTSP